MLMCETKGDKDIYLFDSFTGLSEPGVNDANFLSGQYKSCVAEVHKLLGNYKRVHIVVGDISESCQDFQNVRFSLVHVDVDLYESTRAALGFFGPRVIRGGLLVCHDYPGKAGVRRAVDEYLAEGPRCTCIRTAASQCLLVPLWS